MRFWFRKKKPKVTKDEDIEAAVNELQEEVTLPKEKQSRSRFPRLYRRKSNVPFVKETDAKYATEKGKSKSK